MSSGQIFEEKKTLTLSNLTLNKVKIVNGTAWISSWDLDEHEGTKLLDLVFSRWDVLMEHFSNLHFVHCLLYSLQIFFFATLATYSVFSRYLLALAQIISDFDRKLDTVNAGMLVCVSEKLYSLEDTPEICIVNPANMMWNKISLQSVINGIAVVV